MPARIASGLPIQPRVIALWAQSLTHPPAIACRAMTRTSHSGLDPSAYRVKSGLADASCIDPWYAFAKRTSWVVHAAAS
ncbi:MAG TPA: hypothetical protein VN946_23720 [Terriglobales bacterium]|nr:hypothetical protein [Terriglobales bacterium]